MEGIAMLDSRKKMLEKVKAILSKTMDNGCTESEAMAALAKARELMATYEIEESELSFIQEQEKVIIYKTDPKDPYEIKSFLAVYIAKFTRCRVWTDKKNGDGINFCGMG